MELNRDFKEFLELLNKHTVDYMVVGGFALPDLTAADFCEPDQVVQLGLPPVRIDILTSISGVSWSEAYPDIIREIFQNVPIPFIGKEAYLKNKRASGRPKDLADIDALDEL